ncbi:signal transduction histidine kinase [Actinoplanes abujensis]|uniref:histidine kinase n=2 Tax=Paractinoplanes abujensis TaxID=882441 RepID=A0A7W7G4M7_9ACTN|nr:signal transduction histidine kinase [Actinoplanes abujensis]
MTWMTATGPLPRPGWRALLLDGALAFVLGLASFQAATDDAARLQPIPPMIPDPWRPEPPPESDLGALLLVFVLCAPLVLRRRYPLGVLGATILASFLVLASQGDQQPNLYPCVVVASLIAVYSAAAHSPYRRPALAGIAVAAVFGLVVVEVPKDYLLFLMLTPLTAAVGGHYVWKRRAGEDRERIAAETRAQAEALRDAVDGERARIARELHDVVTHHVSVMVIQAGAARAVLAAEPGQAREALLAVEATGRSALTELRNVMGLLSTPVLEGGPEAPQPGIEGLPALVGRMRDAGVPVLLTVVGDERPIAPGIGLTAYRVVQEALTNMVRHAPGATAMVLVEYTGDALRIEVANTEPTGPAASGPTGGRGLIGLRERLTVYGGSLRAEARPGEGYLVEALIPLETA